MIHPSLPSSLPASLPSLIPPSILHSLLPSVSPSLPPFFTPSLSPSVPPSIPPSIPPNLPLNLFLHLIVGLSLLDISSERAVKTWYMYYRTVHVSTTVTTQSLTQIRATFRGGTGGPLSPLGELLPP